MRGSRGVAPRGRGAPREDPYGAPYGFAEQSPYKAAPSYEDDYYNNGSAYETPAPRRFTEEYRERYRICTAIS